MKMKSNNAEFAVFLINHDENLPRISSYTGGLDTFEDGIEVMRGYSDMISPDNTLSDYKLSLDLISDICIPIVTPAGPYIIKPGKQIWYTDYAGLQHLK